MPNLVELDTMAYRVAENGVAFVTIDVKDRPVNVLTPEMHSDVGRIAGHLAADNSAIGAVIHSGKSTFMAGGDLKRIVGYYDMQRTPEEAYTQSRTYTEALRQLETCGKPVAVAINGTALGGGLELALAGHYRVVQDDEDIMLGLPEVTLGLLPGGGGTQRLPRLIGLRKAAELILSGDPLGPAEALELGVVDAVAPAGDLLAVAEQWVLEGGSATQPWDERGFRIPGGAGLNDINIGRLFQQLTAKVAVETRHNYPAPAAALRCLFNGTTVKSMGAALKIETREFSALTRDPVARNMIRTLFLSKGQYQRPGKEKEQALEQSCKLAFIREGLGMLADGVTPALIENAAYLCGFPEGPLGLADAMSLGAVGDILPDGNNGVREMLQKLIADGRPGREAGRGFYDYAEDGTKALWLGLADLAKAASSNPPVESLKQRLFCAQALAAAGFWESGEIEPLAIDVASVKGWGFPSYTGGVLSYIDTMGLASFIGLCDSLTACSSTMQPPGKWLRARASENDRLYPSMA